MKSRIFKNFVQVGMLILGVIPTGILTVWLGGFAFFMSIKTLVEGEPAALLVIAWVTAGALGVCGLVGSSARVAEANFRLKRWEIIGISCGFAASIPFLFFLRRNGAFMWGSLWLVGPVALSVLTGVAIIAKARHDMKLQRPLVSPQSDGVKAT